MYLSEQVKKAIDYNKSIDVPDIDDELAASRIFYEKFIPMAGEEETIYKGLSHMPSTLITIAEYDPLRDEALLYADKLKESGVKVKQSLYRGMVHGFFQMGGIIDDGNRAIEETAEFLIQNFNK